MFLFYLLPYAVPASFNLFFCPVSVSVVDVLVLYCVCRGGGSIPPVSFCAGALPRLFRLVLDFKSGGIALTLLGAGHSPQTQKKQKVPLCTGSGL